MGPSRHEAGLLHFIESHVALGRSHLVSTLNRLVSVLLVGSLMDVRLCSMLFLCWLSMLSSFFMNVLLYLFFDKGAGQSGISWGPSTGPSRHDARYAISESNRI